jgi:hypothetical protein
MNERKSNLVPNWLSTLLQSSKFYVRFQVLTAASMKMAVFWVVALCSLVEVYSRFRGAYCLHHCPDYVGSKHLWKVGKIIPVYTAQQPRSYVSDCRNYCSLIILSVAMYDFYPDLLCPKQIREGGRCVMRDYKFTPVGVCEKVIIWSCYNRYNFIWVTQ